MKNRFKTDIIALVEIGGSHDECLLSQLVALKSVDRKIVLVTTENIRERNPHFEHYVDTWKFVNLTGAAIADFNEMRKLNIYFSKQNIRQVILNTAQGGHIRNLCITSFSNVRFYGIIHTLRKFNGSFTQKIINLTVQHYLVLNDFFLKEIPHSKLKIKSFYPLRFPQFDVNPEKSKNFTRITLIGGVEERRKDLSGFKSLLESTRHLPIQFVFLGKSKAEDVKRFEGEDEGRLLTFDHFVSHELFDEYVKNSDFILPLVHPDSPSAGEYFKNQISGALNVAFAYKIPLLVHEAYQNWEDLTKNTAFYNLDNFAEILENAIGNHAKMKSSMEQNPKFDPEFQERKYLKFLGLKTKV